MIISHLFLEDINMKLRIDDLENKIQFKEFEDFLKTEINLYSRIPNDTSFNFFHMIDGLSTIPSLFKDDSYVKVTYYNDGLYKIYNKNFETVLFEYLYQFLKQCPDMLTIAKTYEFNWNGYEILKKFFNKYALSDKQVFLLSLNYIQYKEHILNLFLKTAGLTDNEDVYFWDTISKVQKLSKTFIQTNLPKFLNKHRAMHLAGNSPDLYNCSSTTIAMIKRIF